MSRKIVAALAAIAALGIVSVASSPADARGDFARGCEGGRSYGSYGPGGYGCGGYPIRGYGQGRGRLLLWTWHHPRRHARAW
jgi:hypothetical protein